MLTKSTKSKQLIILAVINKEVYKRICRRPPTAPKQHHKSTASVGSGRVAAKIQYDTHQRALSVQIPTASTSLRRSMPSLANGEPVASSLTPTGTVLSNTAADNEPKVGPQVEGKTRNRRFVNFFRPFRSNNDKTVNN